MIRIKKQLGTDQKTNAYKNLLSLWQLSLEAQIM
jgi:hypothetical protein